MAHHRHRHSGGEELSFRYPYKTLAQLQEHSASRRDGVTVEQEARMKRSAVNLIINAGIKMKMDHLGIVAALEFLHRFYAQHSFVTNDRFLLAMACLYLGGKVCDTPKGCTTVIAACVEDLTGDRQEAQRRCSDREWLAHAREAVCRAERALLYQLGFRFSHATVPEWVVNLLLGRRESGVMDARRAPPPPTLPPFLDDAFGTSKADRELFSQLSYFLANQSTKTVLCLQYPPQAVAAACIWMALKMLRVDTAPLRAVQDGRPWYAQFALTPADLETVSSQVMEFVVGDQDAARRLQAGAAGVGVHIEVPAAAGGALSPQAQQGRQQQQQQQRGQGGGDQVHGVLGPSGFSASARGHTPSGGATRPVAHPGSQPGAASQGSAKGAATGPQTAAPATKRGVEEGEAAAGAAKRARQETHSEDYEAMLKQLEGG